MKISIYLLSRIHVTLNPKIFPCLQIFISRPLLSDSSIRIECRPSVNYPHERWSECKERREGHSFARFLGPRYFISLIAAHKGGNGGMVMVKFYSSSSLLPK